MAPKSAVKHKAAVAAQASAESRKKKRESLESVDSIPTGSEAAPSSTASRSPAVEGERSDEASVVPGVSIEGESSAVTSASGEEPSVAGPSSSVVGPSVTPLEDESISHATGERSGSEEEESASTKTPLEILRGFTEDWLDTLDKEELKSISLFLCYHLVHMFSFTETKAAEYAAAMVKKSERTVRRWRAGLIDNNGVLPESQQGRYQRSGILWQNEELNKKAAEYVRMNVAVKGRPNLTTVDFCKWVNECFLPNCTLEPGFPRKIGLETARLWLHHLGFEVLTVRKGIFVDGHE